MEKLGVEKAQLLEELKQEYQSLRAQETGLVKMGTAVPTTILDRIEAIRTQIADLQSSD